MKPRYGLLVVIGLCGLLLPGPPAHAVEYRLLVASVFDTALTSLVTVKDLSDGATGPGLVRLATGLDTGEIDGGAVPPGRSLTPSTSSWSRVSGPRPTGPWSRGATEISAAKGTAVSR